MTRLTKTNDFHCTFIKRIIKITYASIKMITWHNSAIKTEVWQHLSIVNIGTPHERHTNTAV